MGDLTCRCLVHGERVECIQLAVQHHGPSAVVPTDGIEATLESHAQRIVHLRYTTRHPTPQGYTAAHAAHAHSCQVSCDTQSASYTCGAPHNSPPHHSSPPHAHAHARSQQPSTACRAPVQQPTTPHHTQYLVLGVVARHVYMHARAVPCSTAQHSVVQ